MAALPPAISRGRTLRHRSQLSLPAAVESAVDELFGPWNRPQVPGCVVGIVRGGQLIYERGFGSANLDQQVPLTPHSKFYLASVSKQFVATAIGLLVLDQQIRLEDDIRTYVPELPEYDQSITIEHLIHHTNGLRDYLSLMEMAGLPFGDQHSRAELLDLIARQRELEFPPGQRYAYSNTGYFLLAEIVQRVSQKSLRQFTQERIFEPLGMQHTFFHDDRHAVVEGRVTSYCQSTQGARIAYLANWDQVGSGGLLSSLRDLAVWICNFDELRVGGPDLAKLLLQRGKLNDGREIPYAFGLMHGEWRGLATVGHSGSFMGFRTALLRVPSERFAVIVLANEQNLNAEELARQILDICLAEPCK